MRHHGNLRDPAQGGSVHEWTRGDRTRAKREGAKENAPGTLLVVSFLFAGLCPAPPPPPPACTHAVFKREIAPVVALGGTYANTRS